jgi:two-component system, chemotaxis family, CheB/CheR fusion protein
MPDRFIENLMNGRGPGKMLDGRAKQGVTLPQLRLIQTEAVRGYRRDGAGRLYRTSRDGHHSVDLSKFLREIATSSLSAGDQTELLFDLKADGEISIRHADAVALVVSEAIANALKYAHPARVPGKICVASSHNKDQGLVIEVADDGVGLPEGFDPLTAKSAGTRLMRRCAADVSGRLEFAQPPIGLCIRLEMPLSPEGT